MLILKNQVNNLNFDKKIFQVINFLLKKFEKKAEVIVVLSTQEQIQELNKNYRKQDKVTNVLSFPSEVPKEIKDILGDIIICLEVVKNEAKQQNKTTEQHLIHILIHGFLHLLGFNHLRDDEAKIMESLEIEILQEFDINNPYY